MEGPGKWTRQVLIESNVHKAKLIVLINELLLLTRVHIIINVHEAHVCRNIVVATFPPGGDVTRCDAIRRVITVHEGCGIEGVGNPPTLSICGCSVGVFVCFGVIPSCVCARCCAGGSGRQE